VKTSVVIPRAVGLPKGVHDLHVEWSVATMKRGAETQPVPGKTHHDLGRETVNIYLCLESIYQ